MMEWIVCTPAYGVSLNSAKAVREHYLAGKDFRSLSGRGTYLSRRDVEKTSITLEIRYGRQLEKLLVLPT